MGVPFIVKKIVPVDVRQVRWGLGRGGPQHIRTCLRQRLRAFKKFPTGSNGCLGRENPPDGVVWMYRSGLAAVAGDRESWLQPAPAQTPTDPAKFAGIAGQIISMRMWRKKKSSSDESLEDLPSPQTWPSMAGLLTHGSFYFPRLPRPFGGGQVAICGFRPRSQRRVRTGF